MTLSLASSALAGAQLSCVQVSDRSSFNDWATKFVVGLCPPVVHCRAPILRLKPNSIARPCGAAWVSFMRKVDRPVVNLRLLLVRGLQHQFLAGWQKLELRISPASALPSM
jgi:hypothetical protein